MIEIQCPECANYFKSELVGEWQTCHCKECGRTYEIELTEIWKGEKANKFPIKNKRYWLKALNTLQKSFNGVLKVIDNEIKELEAEMNL